MATVVKSDIARQFLGSSIKMEVVELTGVLNDETFVSDLQNPQYALVFPNADAAATTQTMSATVSGRTVTIRDPAVTALVCLVFGQ